MDRDQFDDLLILLVENMFDDMDEDEIRDFVIKRLTEDFEGYSPSGLVKVIDDLYPEILGNGSSNQTETSSESC